MSDCLCETCQLRSTSITYDATYCQDCFAAWPCDRSHAADEEALCAAPILSVVWKASETMPHLFLRLAA